MKRTMTSPSAWIAAAALCLAANLAMAHDHEHDHGHADAPATLALNDGKKWPTDTALRQGMEHIRAAVAQGLTPAPLAERIEGEIAGLVSNCKLTPETDAMFHLVLADLLSGVESLRAQPAAVEKGMAKLSKALRDYPAYFDHPGW